MVILYDEAPAMFETERSRGYCNQCQCWTRAVKMDFGIGAYEYWGCKGVHKDVREVCPSCEQELTEDGPVEDAG